MFKHLSLPRIELKTADLKKRDFSNHLFIAVIFIYYQCIILSTHASNKLMSTELHTKHWKCTRDLWSVLGPIDDEEIVLNNWK